MERESKRTPNQVENTKRRCSPTQSRMDDYNPVPGSYEEDMGSEKQHLEGSPGGARDRGLRDPGEGLESRGLQVGSDSRRCGLLAPENGSYPCRYCPGGLEYSKCESIRGVKK